MSFGLNVFQRLEVCFQVCDEVGREVLRIKALGLVFRKQVLNCVLGVLIQEFKDLVDVLYNLSRMTIHYKMNFVAVRR